MFYLYMLLMRPRISCQNKLKRVLNSFLSHLTISLIKEADQSLFGDKKETTLLSTGLLSLILPRI